MVRSEPATKGRRREGGQLLLVAGGGSGGHVFPGLAVATELEARGWRVGWLGRRGSLEERLVASRGLPFHAVPSRPVLGRGVVGRGTAGITLAYGAWRSRWLASRLGAAAVVGTGGYVAAPAVLGARWASRPTLLVEPNARPGAANRWLSRWAQEAAVAFPSAAEALRCPCQVVGVPVRREFYDGRRERPPGPPWKILVLGGSQGARQLNELLPEALAAWAGPPVRVVHQSGEAHVEATRRSYACVDGAEVEVVPFLGDVAAAMASSHLVVSRAGAVTLAEICAVARPSILVPLAVAGGHQGINAQAMEDAGAAAALGGEPVTAHRLASTLERLLVDGSRLRSMATAAGALGRPNAARDIAARAEQLAAAACPPSAHGGGSLPGGAGC